MKDGRYYKLSQLDKRIIATITSNLKKMDMPDKLVLFGYAEGMSFSLDKKEDIQKE